MKQPWTLADTPFFDERHDEVIARLNRWISDNRARLADETPQDLQAECRHWLQSLAGHGLLEYAAPAMADGMAPAVDLRAICLVAIPVWWRPMCRPAARAKKSQPLR